MRDRNLLCSKQVPRLVRMHSDEMEDVTQARVRAPSGLHFVKSLTL